ncbi:MAG TPA: ABC transporter ATP-binding protein [Methylomirabilota bacterium]|jgi:branched-chain amino acid transport system ATP-binding protein|nr:ABC transporter ATP-binding protein [Methylomirabilota bacterium]
MPRLEVCAVSKRFGGVQALADVSFTVETGRITGLIGPNGAGKTTLFHVICGFLASDAGEIRLDGQRIDTLPPHRVARLGVGRTFQDLKLFRRLSVLDNVLLGFLDEPAERLGRALLRGQPPLRRAARERQAREVLDQVRLRDQGDVPADRLSYGEQKLLAIARVLAADARLVLLDEPVAGLPADMIDGILAIIRGLVARGRTVLLVDHNMEAVMGVSDWVVALDHGRLIIAGSPEAVRADPTVIATYLGTTLGSPRTPA